MNIKKTTNLILVLLIFSLIITGCNSTQRPNPQDNTPSQKNAPNTNFSNSNNDTDTNSPTDKKLPRVENDAEVNDKSNMNNAMPNRPNPVTPTSDVGFTLDDINEFDLEVALTNNDKIDMEYVKGVSNKESKIETVFNGKTERVEHEEASRQIETLINQIPGASLADTAKIIEATLGALETDREDVINFEMEFVFEGGEKVDIEFNKE